MDSIAIAPTASIWTGARKSLLSENTVYDVDLGIEVTGEGAAQNTTNNVVRDNLFFYNSYVGESDWWSGHTRWFV